MKWSKLFSRMIALLFICFLFSCGLENPVNTDDPSNLLVEISLATNGSGEVTIQASATNAVEYQFFIGGQTNPEAINDSGLFSYTFSRSGTYEIEIRAVGTLGRYIKEIRQLEVIVGDGVSVEDGYITPINYGGYNLVWNDEFEGTAVKAENWTFEVGTGCPGNCGWGNNELEYYRKENASVGGGVLTIEAREQAYQGRIYTSARLITLDKQSFQYGRIDIRALLPAGQGMWPALWMLGNNIGSIGWPACGEIDIMEMIGGSGRENRTNGTIHWEKDGEHVQNGGYSTLSSGTLADEYHVFTIIWDESAIKWLINDREYYSVSITPDDMSEFHQKFFFILNLAVGGNWPGSPDSSTVFPQSMKVDYVRVFQKQN